MALTPAELESHLAGMAALASRLQGHLTEREVRFLALLGSVPTSDGDILEIGSYMGKSTVILAKSSARAGAPGRVAAVDPLNTPSVTDPRDVQPAALPTLFRDTLRRNGVDAIVDFHQMKSAELARTWSRPLRLLWIDGDHTYAGARADFDGFAAYLKPGAVVAVHDVLHRFDGPARMVIECMLESDRFGACGFVGSIFWAQHLDGTAQGNGAWAARREQLARRLRALLPYVSAPPPYSLLNELVFKYHRARIPHGDVDPAAWMRDVRVAAAR